ncbi:ATP-binding protein [Aliidongia dinghuensis]|nr:ATP-binding protein [Aliidongia dinghuensis]
MLAMACAAGVLPIADQQWSSGPGSLIIHQTLVSLVYLLTAHLLVRHFLASRTVSLLWIAAGTLYASAMQMLQLWSMPDLQISKLPADRALLMAAWCWFLWHAVLPLAAIGFARSERLAPQQPCAANQTHLLVWGVRATVAALVAISAVMLLTAPWVHPAMVQDGNYRRAAAIGIGPLLVGESLLALFLLWRWTRLKTGLQLFFGLSILALMLDDLLTLAGGVRGSLGWYAGRLEALAAAGCLLALCLGEIGRLYRRVTLASESMMVAEWAFEAEVARRTRALTDRLAELERQNDVLQAEAAVRASALATRTVEHDAAVEARERQAAELEALRTQAEAAGVAKTQFLATMSHELRTPLTGIIGFSDLLLRTEPSPAEQRRYLELQREAAQALLGVVADVLDYANAEAGKLQLDVAPFAPRTLVEDAAAVVRPGIEAKGLAFRLVVAPSVPAGLAGDAGRIRQVMVNLLSNAVKFTQSGSIELRVDYQSRCAHGRDPLSRDALSRDVLGRDALGRDAPGRDAGPALLCLQVLDTGIGIAADKLDRLFQQFSQLDGSNARRYGGSGLGLAICRKLVELMGGHLGVESEEGRGSLFWVELPLAVAAVPEAEPTLAERQPRRILLAEDVVANQILVTAILEANGHLVDVVDDGVAAVTALRRTAYDLVLMDVQMPVMNGVDATRAIRDDEGNARRTPIVALTANASSEDAARCLAAGMDAYVAKPIDEPQLLVIIDRLTAAATTGPARPPVPVLDEVALDGLITRLGRAKAAELVALFRRSVETETAALELARADATAVRGHARAIAGLAGNLGCAELERAARRLAGLREAVEQDELDRHLSVLSDVAARTLSALAARFADSARVVPLPTRRG